MSRSYAIIGTGAIGGFYGAKLQRAGFELHFLMHTDYEYVKDYGLVIESHQGNFTLPQVNAYNNVAQMPKCDVIIVSLKSTQNQLLPQLLPPLMKDDSVVLVLQNGLNIEPFVADLVGHNRVMGGLCFICSHKFPGGKIKHIDYGAINLADYSLNYTACGITQRMKQIAQDLKKAEIEVKLIPDLKLARWQKLVWNIPYNGLSVILRGTTNELMNYPHTLTLVKDLMAEVATAASACDCIIPSDFIEQMLDNTRKMKPYSPSMMLDYQAKRPLEVEAIFGNPWREAIKHNCNVPKIETLYYQLKFLDEQNVNK